MNNILSYFDLNKRKGGSQEIDFSAIDEVKNEATAKILYRMVAKEGGVSSQKSKQMPLGEQLLLYFGIVIGVLFSSIVAQFGSSGFNLNLTAINILVSIVIAFIIIPTAFEKLSVKPEAPLLIRFGLFVQNGVFWQVLLKSIGTAVAI